jgi:hypothetical protein
MKILAMDSTYRHWLVPKAVLAFDSHLNAHFIGLKHSESVFSSKCRGIRSPLASRDVIEIERFLSLHERHNFALALQHEAGSFKAPY